MTKEAVQISSLLSRCIGNLVRVHHKSSRANCSDVWADISSVSIAYDQCFWRLLSTKWSTI